MNLAVITACLFATEDPIHYLKASCNKFGISLHAYGLGSTYTDWPDIKINKMLTHFKRLKAEGFSHALYTDGRDSFFVAPVEEAQDKYTHIYGQPDCLMAAETTCYPRMELADQFPDPGHHYRWLGSGQFMGQLDYLIDAWQMLKELGTTEADQNEQGWMLKAFVEGRFGAGFVLDTACHIFQSAGNSDVQFGPEGELTVQEGRVYNKVTQTYPVAVHFNGGYSCPVNGKYDTIEPVWRSLGNEPTERKTA